jgi:hypothetical protein
MFTRLMIRPVLLSACLVLLSCTRSGPSAEAPFEKIPVQSAVLPGVIDEASGIADSYSNPGFLWVELDSGNPPVLHLLKHDGTHGDSVYIKGATNRDWEDIAISTGPVDTKKYLYVAEIGDNALAYSSYRIYRFPEPFSSIDTVSVFDKIDFKYPDGPHDAEAIIVDGATRDIYVITKRDQFSKVFKLEYPQKTSSMNIATFVGDLPYKGVVSAAISGDQTELLIKTYGQVNYYRRKTGESFEKIFAESYQAVPYQVEPQGEAVCFNNNKRGFFTLSEKGFMSSVKLNYYRRK